MSENGEIYTAGKKNYTATGSDGREKISPLHQKMTALMVKCNDASFNTNIMPFNSILKPTIDKQKIHRFLMASILVGPLIECYRLFGPLYP